MDPPASAPVSSAHGATDGCFFRVASQLPPRAGAPSLHVAVAGGRKEVVFEGFRAFPATHVLLLHTKADAARARRLRDALCEAGIPARVEGAGDDAWGIVQALGVLVLESRLLYSEIFVNVSSGPPAAGCAATTAAYLHGLKAFHMEGGQASLLPVLRVTGRDVLSEADVALLLALAREPQSERRLARASRLREARVRAHLEGEPGHKGLLGLGLVQRIRRFGVLSRITLSPTGRMLLATGLLAAAGSPQRPEGAGDGVAGPPGPPRARPDRSSGGRGDGSA